MVTVLILKCLTKLKQKHLTRNHVYLHVYKLQTEELQRVTILY